MVGASTGYLRIILHFLTLQMYTVSMRVFITDDVEKVEIVTTTEALSQLSDPNSALFEEAFYTDEQVEEIKVKYPSHFQYVFDVKATWERIQKLAVGETCHGMDEDMHITRLGDIE
jgi:hypothetical protein